MKEIWWECPLCGMRLAGSAAHCDTCGRVEGAVLRKREIATSGHLSADDVSDGVATCPHCGRMVAKTMREYRAMQWAMDALGLDPGHVRPDGAMKVGEMEKTLSRFLEPLSRELDEMCQQAQHLLKRCEPLSGDAYAAVLEAHHALKEAHRQVYAIYDSVVLCGLQQQLKD